MMVCGHFIVKLVKSPKPKSMEILKKIRADFAMEICQMQVYLKVLMAARFHHGFCNLPGYRYVYKHI